MGACCDPAVEVCVPPARDKDEAAYQQAVARSVRPPAGDWAQEAG